MVKRSEVSMLMAVTFAFGMMVGGTLAGQENVFYGDVILIGVGVFIVWAILTGVIVAAYLTGQDSK